MCQRTQFYCKYFQYGTPYRTTDIEAYIINNAIIINIQLLSKTLWQTSL